MHHTAIMANPEKTQAVRMLDAKRIAYTASVYDATREFHSAEEAAALLGASVDTVYKTLVVLREAPGRPRPLLVIIPSHRQVDLQRQMGKIIKCERRFAAHRKVWPH